MNEFHSLTHSLTLSLSLSLSLSHWLKSINLPPHKLTDVWTSLTLSLIKIDISPKKKKKIRLQMKDLTRSHSLQLSRHILHQNRLEMNEFSLSHQSKSTYHHKNTQKDEFLTHSLTHTLSLSLSLSLSKIEISLQINEFHSLSLVNTDISTTTKAYKWMNFTHSFSD